jgi:hypothetical protein
MDISAWRIVRDWKSNCIDTNVVLGMFGRHGPCLPIRQALIDGRLVWAITTEILLSCEKIAAREMGLVAAAQLLRFIDLLRQPPPDCLVRLLASRD